MRRPRFRAIIRFAGTVILASSGACHSTADPVACSNLALAVSVTESTPTPTFTWVPDCGIAKLRVENVVTHELDWLIANAQSNIRSGVVYGAKPATAGVEAGPIALRAGWYYTVYLYNTEDLAIGRKDFQLMSR